MSPRVPNIPQMSVQNPRKTRERQPDWMNERNLNQTELVPFDETTCRKFSSCFPIVFLTTKRAEINKPFELIYVKRSCQYVFSPDVCFDETRSSLRDFSPLSLIAIAQFFRNTHFGQQSRVRAWFARPRSAWIGRDWGDDKQDYSDPESNKLRLMPANRSSSTLVRVE